MSNIYLLASDYDKTLSIVSPLTKYNSRKINEFIDNGNKFAIVTLRNYRKIITKTKKYDLHYNYLSTLNGSAIFDDHSNLIYKHTILDSTVEKVVKSLEKYKNFIIISALDEFDEKNKNACVRINIIVLNPALIYPITQRLKEINNIIFKWFPINNFFAINILSSEINKSDSVRFIAQKEDIEHEKIFVVGDSKDDEQMIRDYNGYASILANYECMKNAKGIVVSVGDLAQNIQEGFTRKRKL